MSFFTKTGLNKQAILDYYRDKIALIHPDLQGDENIENRRKFISVLELNDKNVSKDYTVLANFSKILFDRLIENTPIESDEKHMLKHPTEPHLKDAWKGEPENVFGRYVRLFNNNSYAAAVHENAGRRGANFMLNTAHEISAIYHYPFYIYAKITQDELGLVISSESNSPVEGYVKIEEANRGKRVAEKDINIDGNEIVANAVKMIKKEIADRVKLSEIINRYDNDFDDTY